MPAVDRGLRRRALPSSMGATQINSADCRPAKASTVIRYHVLFNSFCEGRFAAVYCRGRRSTRCRPDIRVGDPPRKPGDAWKPALVNRAVAEDNRLIGNFAPRQLREDSAAPRRLRCPEPHNPRICPDGERPQRGRCRLRVQTGALTANRFEAASRVSAL